MKIAVLNSSGNVGKSTITKEFLYPRLEDSLIVEIETVNASNINNENLNVKNYNTNDEIEELYFYAIESDNVIVDIGASNLSGFFEKVLDFEGFLEVFDYFLIPTVSTIKETEDTIKTIEFLKEIGVDEEKIKVLPNKVKKSVESEFSILFKNATIEINPNIFIKESKLFSNLALLKSDIVSVYNSDLDCYKQSILEADSPQEKMRLIKMDMSNRMAHTIIKNFDDNFRLLFDEEPKEVIAKEVEMPKKPTPKKPKKEKESKPEPEQEELNIEDSEDF